MNTDIYTTEEIYALSEGVSAYGALQAFIDNEETAFNMNGGHTTYEGQVLDVNKGTLIYKDIERHAIALGPKLQNPDFDTQKKEDIDPAQMAYGTCVDISIQLNGEKYYIPAVIVDVKAHTASNGYCQTYKTFTGEVEKPQGAENGNIVEWYVKQFDSNENNKSAGLKNFNETAEIIIYRDEVME